MGVFWTTTDQRLAPVKATSVYADLHLEQVEVTALGDYKTESLAQHVNSYSVNQLVVRTYLHRACEWTG